LSAPRVRAARAEEQNACARQFQFQILTNRQRDAFGIGVEAVRANFIRHVSERVQRLPGTFLVSRFRSESYSRHPRRRGFIECIHHLEREEFVRHGEIQPDELHRLGAGDGARRFPGARSNAT